MAERRDAASRSPGQNALIQAVRLTENKKMGEIVKEASIDDLEWFAQMLELQLEETPNWIEDEIQLHKMQAWTRRVRTMTIEILHNKRVPHRRLKLLKTALCSLSLVIIGWALAKYFG